MKNLTFYLQGKRNGNDLTESPKLNALGPSNQFRLFKSSHFALHR